MNDPAPADILLVDDNPTNLQFLLPIFEAGRYRPRVAKSGARALQLIAAQPPDLILLDIMMPDMSGYEVCQRLKSDPATADIPIIFLSALSNLEDKLQAFQVGGVDYVTKPFYAAELLTRVNTHLTQRRLQRELAASNAELQRQVGELDAYAHTVAHDLRSPLANIMGYLDLIFNQGPLPPDMERKTLEALWRNSHKMNDIIRELLLLATIRQQKEIPSEPLLMQEIVENARIQLERTLSDKNGEIRLENPAAWPTALGYAPWIEEVWVNYLSNALKYGGDPPQVVIGGEAQGATARFWVRDNGPGLTAAEQARLFAPFERLKQARAQGHGLGLSIVRRIVGTLGGAVGVESEPGRGSLFYFTLPTAVGDQT